MSIRTLLIWIIIAGILGAGVLVTRAQQQASRDAQPASSTRTIGFDPVSISAIERLVDDQREILERDPTRLEQWSVHWAQGGMDHRWAVQSNKAKGALRMLSTARIQTLEDDQLNTIGGELLLRQTDGSSIRIEFDSTSSGGFNTIRIEHRDTQGVATARWFGRIQRRVYDALISTNLRQWRSKQLFELPNSSIRRVELEAGGLSLVLARTSSGWIIQEPFAIHGDTQTIENLIKVLGSLQANGFVDDPVDQSTTGLGSPIAKIRLASESRNPSLTIGTRADVGGSSVYGQVETEMGSALVTLKTDQLAKLTAAAEPYIARTPSSATLGSVVGIQINGRDARLRFQAKRELGKWTIGETQADSVNRDAIDRLIGLLLHEPATVVNVIDADSAIEPVGSVALIGADGRSLDELGFAIDSTPSGMRLLLIHQLDDARQVIWGTVSDDAAATGAWLTAVAGKRVP